MLKKPQTFLQLVLAIFIGIYAFTLVTSPAYCVDTSDLEDQIDQTNQQITEKKGVLASIEKRISEISNSNYTVSQKISLINEEITKLNASITSNEKALNTKIKEIEDKQALLELKKKNLDSLSSELYIQSRFRISTFFLSDQKWDEMVKDFFVKKSAIGLLKDEVEQINGEFSSLTESKVQLESQKIDLEEEKQGLADSYDLLAQEKSKLQAELNSQYAIKSSISQQIGNLKKQLSSIQLSLYLARQGSTIIDSNSVPSSGEYITTLAGFREKASTGTFAVFSFGAWTHRNGMSQWGAKARADAGQTYETILSAYYPQITLNKTYSEPATIKVKGTGDSCTCQKRDSSGKCVSYTRSYDETIPFSTYMKGIYEMPPSWNIEAVKAQAVASRSYAIAQIKAKGYVAPNQGDQVYKDCENIKAWRTAVNSTQGQVLTVSGKAYSAQFSAVAGGYLNTSKWDTTDKSGNGNWWERAWEQKSNVSWFYKTWYRDENNDSTCNRNPWVTQEEMADLVNTASYLAKLLKSGGSDTRIVPIADACHSSGNPYSYTKMRNLSDSKATKVFTAVTVNSGGTTQYIKFTTDAGDITINGDVFKMAYNLRAPGHLHIPQNSFVHIKIEMK